MNHILIRVNGIVMAHIGYMNIRKTEALSSFQNLLIRSGTGKITVPLNTLPGFSGIAPA